MLLFWWWDHPIAFAIVNGVGIVLAIWFYRTLRKID